MMAGPRCRPIFLLLFFLVLAQHRTAAAAAGAPEAELDASAPSQVLVPSSSPNALPPAEVPGVAAAGAAASAAALPTATAVAAAAADPVAAALAAGPDSGVAAYQQGPNTSASIATIAPGFGIDDGLLGDLPELRVWATIRLYEDEDCTKLCPGKDANGNPWGIRTYKLSPYASHWCDTRPNSGDNGPGYWQVKCFTIDLDKDAGKTLAQVPQQSTQCTERDVRIALYDNDYCSGYPLNDAVGKGPAEYYLYQAGPPNTEHPTGQRKYKINSGGTDGRRITSIRPSVILPCSNGGGGWSPGPGLPAQADTSEIGVKIILWPGKKDKGPFPYMQHGCLKPTPNNNLLGKLVDDSASEWYKYPISQCLRGDGDKFETAEEKKKAKEHCEATAAKGCASGIDRIYCLALKPWDSKKTDVVGAGNWGYDFANKNYFTGNFPAAFAMVNLWTNTKVGFDESYLKQGNMCVPPGGNALHLPQVSTCVMTRFYPKIGNDGCSSTHWRRDANGISKSAREDGALMLIGMGMTSKGPKWVSSGDSGLPGGGWGVAHEFTKGWPASIYCVYTRTVDDKDPDCKRVLTKKTFRRSPSQPAAAFSGL